MIRYKALQEDLIHKINALETTLTEQKEELDMSKHELRELCRDKDDIITHKERIIGELKVSLFNLIFFCIFIKTHQLC